MPKFMRILTILWTGCAFVTAAAGVANAAYPDRPVHFYVGYAPGGGTDSLARLVAQGLTEKWGQSVIVENKAGSSGVISENFVAHAPADGYSVAWVTNDHTVTPAMYQLSYDPLNDLVPLTQVAYIPDVLLAIPSLKVDNLKDLVALAKGKPGVLNFGSPGNGSAPFLETEALMQLTGIKMVHVGFRGGPEVVAAMLGGEVQLYFAAMSTALPHFKSGALKALAVSAHVRAPLMPDVPTVAQALNVDRFDAANTDWTGTLVAAGTPKPIIDKLYADIAEVVRSQETGQRIAGIGFVPVLCKPEEFDQTIRTLMARWADLLKTVDVK